MSSVCPVKESNFLLQEYISWCKNWFLGARINFLLQELISYCKKGFLIARIISCCYNIYQDSFIVLVIKEILNAAIHFMLPQEISCSYSEFLLFSIISCHHNIFLVITRNSMSPQYVSCCFKIIRIQCLVWPTNWRNIDYMLTVAIASGTLPLSLHHLMIDSATC